MSRQHTTVPTIIDMRFMAGYACNVVYVSLSYLFRYTTQTLISIKTLFLITGHVGNLTPKILL